MTDHKHGLAWMKTCIIIHTLVSFVEEGDENNDFIDELVREGAESADVQVIRQDRDQSDMQRERQGQTKRAELKMMLFESLHV